MNCAIVQVIHTILVWSPVLLQESVVILNFDLIVAVVSSPVFVPLRFVAEILPLSSIDAPLFCSSFQVVVSKRAIALSVEEAGQTTSPVPIPSVPLSAITAQYVTFVGRFPVEASIQI